MKPGNLAGRQPRFNPYKKPVAGKKNQVKPRKPKPNDAIYVSSSDSDDDVIYVRTTK
jgi:hypothetical protein